MTPVRGLLIIVGLFTVAGQLGACAPDPLDVQRTPVTVVESTVFPTLPVTTLPSTTTTIATTTTTVAAVVVEDPVAIVREVWPDDTEDQALAVFRCESHLNPDALGKLGERGIAQIHPVHRDMVRRMGFSWDQMFDARDNVTVALDIFEAQGWGPWSCRRVLS